MNLDLLGNWRGGAVNDAAQEAIRNHGTQALNHINIGPLETLWGANPDLVKSRIKSLQQQAINDNPQLQALGIQAGLPIFEQSGGMANYGETAAGFQTRAKQAIDTKTENDRQRLRKEGIEAEGRQQGYRMEEVNAGIRAQGDRLAAQLESQSNQFNHTSRENHANRQFERSENSLNRTHERELSSSKDDLQMQLALMQSDLAEKRMAYDRETQRMDRRDRIIAQLMQGIGQLGGAFSL